MKKQFILLYSRFGETAKPYFDPHSLNREESATEKLQSIFAIL